MAQHDLPLKGLAKGATAGIGRLGNRNILPMPLSGVGLARTGRLNRNLSWRDRIGEDLRSGWFKDINLFENVLDGNLVIGIGAAGSFVYRLQEALAHYPFRTEIGIDETTMTWRIDLGKDGVDGKYGQHTSDSIENFQKWMNMKFMLGLDEDGMLGRETLYWLDFMFMRWKYPPVNGSGFYVDDTVQTPFLKRRYQAWGVQEIATDDLAISCKYADADQLLALDQVTRMKIIWALLGDRVNGTYEEAIINLLNGCPAKQVDYVGKELGKNSGYGFNLLESSIQMQNYKDYHSALSNMMLAKLGPTGYFEYAISEYQVEDYASGPRADVVPWKDTQFSGYIAYSFKFSANGAVDITGGRYGVMSNLEGSVISYRFQSAFEPILLYLEADEPALGVAGKKGTQILMPVINMKMLQNEQLKDTAFATLAAISIVTGVGAIAGVSTVFKGIIVTLDILVGAATLVVEENRRYLMETYPELLGLWDNFNMILGIYGMARLVYELPQLATGLYNGLAKVKGDVGSKLDDFRTNLKQAIDEADNMRAQKQQPGEEFISPTSGTQADMQIPNYGNYFDDIFREFSIFAELRQIKGVTVQIISKTRLAALKKLKVDNGLAANKNASIAEVVGLNKDIGKTEFSAYPSFDRGTSRIPEGSPSVSEADAIFKTKSAPNAYGTNLSRTNDAEAKIFQEIAAKMGAKPGDAGRKIFESRTGTINIYSELVPCGSCSAVIKQFKEMFPNVKINIYSTASESF
jgi:hypothetical protein